MNKFKTGKLAISRGMEREVDLDQKCTHCPECGCPWFGNKNLCGEGARVCWNCHQDWYVDTDYQDSSKLKELPKGAGLGDKDSE